MKRNLLIISENFTFGGLETHILGEARWLNDLGWTIYFLSGNKATTFSDQKIGKVIQRQLPLNYLSDIDSLIEAVDIIQYCIDKYDITHVHVHPFLSLLPAHIAGSIKSVPVVSTLHGPSSVGGVYGVNYDNILDYIYRNTTVLAVSCEIKNLLNQRVNVNIAPWVEVIPNGVPKVKNKPSAKRELQNMSWLIVARLDEQKAEGIEKFINLISGLGYGRVDVVGDGPARAALELNCSSSKIKFLGQRDDILDLMRKYDGVAGMGRVFLESVSVGKVSCLVGYDGIKGIVRRISQIDELSYSNFSGRGFENISREEFTKQYEELTVNNLQELQNFVHRHYSDAVVWRRFHEKLLSVQSVELPRLLSVYSRIKGDANIAGNWLVSDAARKILNDTMGSRVEESEHEESNLMPQKPKTDTTLPLSEYLLLQSSKLSNLIKSSRISRFKASQKIEEKKISLLSSGAYGLRVFGQGQDIADDVIGQMRDTILQSQYFDESFYLAKNKDVAKSGMDPLTHYIKYGAYEGRNPSAKFDAHYYLAHNHDVREMRVNPLLHYILDGKKEGRLPCAAKRITSRRKVDHKRVDIVNINFYDWQGEVLYKGGAERYVFDLANIVKDMGYRPRIIQNATTAFSKRYRGIEVIGVETGATDVRGISKAYREFCKDAGLIIASPLDLACELQGLPVIGINHGIHWDNVNRHLYSNRSEEYSDIFDSLEVIEKAVCVDTNFINWTRTYDYSFGSKLQYIPNYFDNNDFVAKEKTFSDKLVFTYPRRLYEARGIYITLNAFDKLLKKYDDIELRLVGQTNDKDVKKAVKKLIKTYPNNVSLTEYAMEDMHLAYEDSHVIIIPTLYSEGTSLSCIEGMATNNAIIATNVGGLPNLIMSGYNGLLTDPTSESLATAVEKLINDRTGLETMAQNALNTSKVFEKKQWNDSWKLILKESLK